MEPWMYMLALGVALGLAGAALLLTVVVAAFRDSVLQGVLCLLVPGYVLYYGLAKMASAARFAIVGGAVGCFVAAAVVVNFVTAFDPVGDDPPEVADEVPDDWGSFDDLEPPPPSE